MRTVFEREENMSEPWKPKPCPICKDPMVLDMEGLRVYARHAFKITSDYCPLYHFRHPRLEWNARTGATDVQ